MKPHMAGARPQSHPQPALEKEVTIYIGGVHAAANPEVVKTLLGSCISVCLYDPVTHVGGMNHFMLPHGGEPGRPQDLTRFGVHAMDSLIGNMMKLGGDRRRFVAKFFGGAHVLDLQESAVGVPQQNIAFIRRFLSDEGIRVLAEDVGGYQPRNVRFYTSTGRALVKRVEGARTKARLLSQERRKDAQPPSYGTVELFD